MVATAKIEQPKGKSRPLPDLSAGDAAAHNGPDREEFLFMTGQISKAKTGVKAAQKHLKAMRSQAKLRGIELEQMDDALAERERNEGTTVAGLRTFKRYCEFLNLPIGSQITLFDSPRSSTLSQEAILKRSYDQGYERGVGGDFPDDQAYPPATPEGEAHGEGWKAGQKVNTDKFSKLSEDLQAADRERAEKAAKKAAKLAAGEDDDGDDEQDDGDGADDGEGADQPAATH